MGQRSAGPARPDAWDARAWVTLFFLPIVPLGSASFRGSRDGPPGEPWEVERERVRPEAPSRKDIGVTYASAVGLALVTLVPPALAWQTIHQTGLWQALKVVIGSSVPVLVLMWRDLRTPRVVR